MHKVTITKGGIEKYGSTFNTREEADNWIQQQESKGSWGKSEKIMIVTEMLPNVELIEKVKGPMGIPAFKVRFPADYEVVVTEFDPALSNFEEKSKKLIEKRDQILCATDYLFISDVQVVQKHRKMYLEYRQYLRDLPKTFKKGRELFFEEFSEWLRRNHPEEFMDGGKSKQIILKFMYYVK